MLVFLAGTLGIAAARGHGRLLLPCLVIGSAIVSHVLTMATVRYRLPCMPLFIIYAAGVIAAPDVSPRAMSRGRWLWLALTWVFFFGLCVPYFYRAYAARF